MSLWKRLSGDKKNQGGQTPPDDQPAATPPSPPGTPSTPRPPSTPPAGSAASPATQQGSETSAGRERVVRIFISSTFRDMHAERDELVKYIFPELRKKCRERQVEFVEVDLRWGISEDETKQGKVLPIIMKEIEHSKPYFIRLLGERYGWAPDTIPQELIEHESWLNEHVGKTGKSVTELEILHGVFNNPDMAKHAFFYFRDPAYMTLLINP